MERLTAVLRASQTTHPRFDSALRRALAVNQPVRRVRVGSAVEVWGIDFLYPRQCTLQTASLGSRAAHRSLFLGPKAREQGEVLAQCFAFFGARAFTPGQPLQLGTISVCVSVKMPVELRQSPS